MTDTADQHAARAVELAAKAEAIHQGLANATEEHGAVRADLHAAFLAEMNALTGLAQVYATLATRPGQTTAAFNAATDPLGPAPKSFRCPVCTHPTTLHREHGCDFDCDCPQPFGRIAPGDPDPTDAADRRNP